ncbi:MAG: tyrosine-protein phosphatase [Oscillospiraceae bacterium]|nr:tyrosine-protein phosphatase [Oscillospiraceae bacterium]
MTEHYRRLPLEGLRNARDLGGYPIPGGGVTRFGRFIRCEVPRRLTETDLALLRELGVTASIDFRGDMELEHYPSALRDVPWCEYIHIPTFNEQVAFPRDYRPERVFAFVRWGDKYTEMLRFSGNWVRSVLETMASRKGAVMYNCTTGKDRTGIISALLLGLAGVDDRDIIADYCVSQVYLREVYLELAETLPGERETGETVLTDPFFRTEPENMEAMLDYIHANFGSVADYVRSVGVDDGTVETLRSRLAGA